MGSGARSFFTIWRNAWDLLKPRGLVVATVPSPKGIWVWQDPGTTQVYSVEKLWYLDQAMYEKVPGMTDYREDLWPKPYSFKLVHQQDNGHGLTFVLEKERDESQDEGGGAGSPEQGEFPNALLGGGAA